jgi:ABC-type oligopeptide transport system ATPase subunit
MFKFESLGLGKVRDKVNKTVNESRMPSKEFESTVGVYGGKLKIEDDGKMVWNNRGIISKIDKTGDAVLRNYDEHVMKNPWEFFKRNPSLFFKFFMPGAKRFRGNKDEISENIERLGLDDVYGLHDKGIEIKDQELFTNGAILQDIYRADLIGGGVEELANLDKTELLARASSYLKEVHDNYGAVGEVLPSDFIFRKDENGNLGEPVLNIPDIVFNEKKTIGEKEKKTTDLLDFVISMGVEDFRISQDKESMKRTMKTILESYNDEKVISLLQSFIKRGRLTLAGDKNSENVNIPSDSFTTKNRGVFTKHNEARIVNNRELEVLLKDSALEVCQEMKQV